VRSEIRRFGASAEARIDLARAASGGRGVWLGRRAATASQTSAERAAGRARRDKDGTGETATARGWTRGRLTKLASVSEGGRSGTPSNAMPLHPMRRASEDQPRQLPREKQSRVRGPVRGWKRLARRRASRSRAWSRSARVGPAESGRDPGGGRDSAVTWRTTLDCNSAVGVAARANDSCRGEARRG